MGEACSTYGWEEKVLVGKSEEKRPLGKHRRRWEDNCKMYVQEVWWEGTDWIDLEQDCDIETSGSIKCGEFLD